MNMIVNSFSILIILKLLTYILVEERIVKIYFVYKLSQTEGLDISIYVKGVHVRCFMGRIFKTLRIGSGGEGCGMDYIVV